MFNLHHPGDMRRIPDDMLNLHHVGLCSAGGGRLARYGGEEQWEKYQKNR